MLQGRYVGEGDPGEKVLGSGHVLVEMLYGATKVEPDCPAPELVEAFPCDVAEISVDIHDLMVTENGVNVIQSFRILARL